MPEKAVYLYKYIFGDRAKNVSCHKQKHYRFIQYISCIIIYCICRCCAIAYSKQYDYETHCIILKLNFC